MNSHRSTRIHSRRRPAAAAVALAVTLAVALAPAGAGADTPTPTVTSLTSLDGTLSVQWTLDVVDATTVDAILYDQSGDVVEDDTLDPSVTSDTFTGVDTGAGYYVVVTATTPDGSVSSPASAPVDVVADAAPTITAVTGSGGDVSVTWVNDAPDATGIDVTLYDQNCDVVADDAVAPDATSDTFTGVADGGYSVDVVAHSPGGDLDAGGSDPFDLYQGAYVDDAAPTITAVTGTGGDVSVTWVNDAPNATGIDVTLYNQNGDVVADDAVAADATSDTFTGVADGQGYVIDVVAHTPGGDLDSGPSASFDLAGGSFSSDAAPQVATVTSDHGDVSITWVDAAPDATGIDVILYDPSGDVVADDVLAPDATTDTFTGVPDGDGYVVAVVAHTPFGDFTGDSWSFSLLDGSLAPVPVFGGWPGRSPIVVDPSTVTLTAIDGGAGGWTVTWPELDSAPTDGYYLVSTDQGDECTAEPTGQSGTLLSCTLAPRADGSSTLSGLNVEFEPYLIEYSLAGGIATDRSAPGAAVTSHASTDRAREGTEPDAVVATSVGTPRVPGRIGAPQAPIALVLGGGALVLLGALGAWWRRRRIA
jgi:hypothetical protein